MHYCVHLLTKELPTENQIAEILQPYNGVEFWENIPEDMPYEEVEHLPFTWDWYQIGGRYKAQLKLKVDENDKHIIGCCVDTIQEMADYSGVVYCLLYRNI